MDLAAELGLGLGAFSEDEDDVEEVSLPPTHASSESTANFVCAIQEEEDDDAGRAVTAAAQPARYRQGRPSYHVRRILAEAAIASAAAAASLGDQQQPAKKSRCAILAGARATKKLKREQSHVGTAVLKGKAPQCFTPQQQEALKNVMYSTSAGGVSAVMMAQLLKVSRSWLPPLHGACAEEMMVQDESAFRQMLIELRQRHKEGLVEPIQFTLFRMYDETPERFRTVTASGSSVEADCCTAKVLACQREWCMLFAQPGRVTLPAELGNTAGRPAGFGMDHNTDDSTTQYTSVWGVLSTSLIPIQNQTAEVLLTATRRMAWLPPECQAIIEALFLHRALVSTTDMHGSNVKAEKAMSLELAVDGPETVEHCAAEQRGLHSAKAKRSCGWNCVQVRCEMHRSHTCELKTHDIVASTVSGVLNVGLSLRIPGAAGRFRRALRKFICEPDRLVILRGEPTHEVITWRTAINDLFTRQGTKRSRLRAAVIGRLCNGDIRRSDRLEHFCSENCCPGGLQQTKDKFCRYLVPALTKRLPMIFPRRKWIGSDESLDDCGWLMACHGLLPTLFEESTSPATAAAPAARPPPARGPRPRPAGPAALAALPRAPAAVGGAPPAAIQLQEPDHAVPPPAAAPPAAARPVAVLPAAAPPAADPPADHEPDSREDNEIKRGWAGKFLADEPLAHIVLLRVVLEPFRILKARLLETSSAAWRERQLMPIGGQRTHPLTRSWHACEAVDALAELTLLMTTRKRWDALDTSKLRDGLWAVTALRLLARAGAGIRELLVAEQRVYPYKLFAMLGQPQLSEEVAADFAERPCMFDPVSASICREHSSAIELCSPAAQSKIMSIAELVQTSTAKVECGHAAVRRRARGQVQTHAPSLAVQSAHRAVARGRRLVSESWPVRSGLRLKPGQSDAPPGQSVHHAKRVQPKGLKRAAPLRNDVMAGAASKRPRRTGGGGSWRVYCHEELQKEGNTFHGLGVAYRALDQTARARLKHLGSFVTAAHKSGIVHPLGRRRRTGCNRAFKALDRRKKGAKLAKATWDRNAQLASVEAEFADRTDLIGDVIAEDRRRTTATLQAEQALLKSLRQHAVSMGFASDPGLCPSGDVFDEPGGMLFPPGGSMPDGGADSGSDSSAGSPAPQRAGSAGSRAPQQAAVDSCPAPQLTAVATQHLRSLWHLPRRLENVEAAVLALGIGPGSGVASRGSDWEARHTVITAAECPKIGKLPQISLCQRSGRCTCKGSGKTSALLYRRIQHVLRGFVLPAGAPGCAF